MPRHEDVRRRLDHEVQAYVYEVLREIFDFDRLCGRLRLFRKFWGDNLADIYPDEYQRLLSEVAKVEDCRGVGAGLYCHASEHIDGNSLADTEDKS